MDNVDFKASRGFRLIALLAIAFLAEAFTTDAPPAVPTLTSASMQSIEMLPAVLKTSAAR
jgi:hypothetical protein